MLLSSSQGDVLVITVTAVVTVHDTVASISTQLMLTATTRTCHLSLPR